jgi:head-tail adaptor
MRAGAMRYRLALLEPQRLTDRMGAERVEYVEVRTVHAERVRTTGSRSEEVGEHFPTYSAEFNIRDAHPVSENWRVRQLGGHLYTVLAIVPNIDRGYKTLYCERVNE